MTDHVNEAGPAVPAEAVADDAHGDKQPADVHHADAHAHDDAKSHGHGEHDGAALGPVDGPAWGAAALGILLGLVIAGAFVLATSGLPAA